MFIMPSPHGKKQETIIELQNKITPKTEFSIS